MPNIKVCEVHWYSLCVCVCVCVCLRDLLIEEKKTEIKKMKNIRTRNFFSKTCQTEKFSKDKMLIISELENSHTHTNTQTKMSDPACVFFRCFLLCFVSF